MKEGQMEGQLFLNGVVSGQIVLVRIDSVVYSHHILTHSFWNLVDELRALVENADRKFRVAHCDQAQLEPFMNFRRIQVVDDELQSRHPR